MEQLHNIQMAILKKLLFANTLKFSELKPSDAIENNQLNFHIKQLISFKLVEKLKNEYRLTAKGKEFANRMDTDVKVMEKQAKISAWVCATKIINDEKHYLVYTRLKHPFYGAQGFLSGKLKYGEQVIEGAARELKDETGLTGKAHAVQVRHYRVYAENELVEDKFMFLCLVEEPQGELVGENEEGKYEWVKKSDFETKVTNHFQSFQDFLNDINIIDNFNGHFSFVEEDHVSEKF